MKKAFIFSFLALFISITGLSTHADAKRFGGGMSFGKSFNKQKSFSKPAPANNLTSQKAASGAKAGGMMGMLGGLAMGGLLGALFFGGAFEGINFMDIIMFAGIGLLIFWVMRKAAANQQPAYAHAGHNTSPYAQQPQTDNDAFMGSASTSTMLKPEIDTEHFVEAARNIFMRMQAAWDAKDMADIRSFCTADIADHVAMDMEKLGGNSTKTEVGMLDASITDSWVESNLEWVAVHFTAILKEETLDDAGNNLENANSQVNEHWIFQHNPHSKDPTWYLAGIQQA